ncbi:Protein abhd16a [Chamberlinius hualienensis]
MAGLWWDCLVGPRLSRIYRELGQEGRLYKPNLIEICGNGIIKTLGIVWRITLYTSPLIVTILFRKNYFNRYRLINCMKFSVALGVFFVGSVIIRGIGRYANPEYNKFLLALNNAKANLCTNTKKELSRYDFSFWAWPVEFRADGGVKGEKAKPIKKLPKKSSKTIVEMIKSLPCQILSYVVAHTVGRRLLYPGSLQLLQSAMESYLSQGRLKIIEEFNGERFKLLTRDHNEIDAMFVDQRINPEFANGDTLVICCEGNAGFYEVGIMDTPLNAKYSVLGWNHPGFGGSTGEPFPEQEHNAIDIVVQFAIEKLGFNLENIVLYAWSIGGYSAIWAAVNYPQIQGIILDATFDDLVPLAVEQMPKSWKPLVVRTVREHLNLNNGELLAEYNGPVLLVRRLKDEVITSGRSNDLKANRGNYLLSKLLQTRFPYIFSNEHSMALLQRWLASDRSEQELLWSEYITDEVLCENLATSCITDEYGVFPSNLGDDMNENMRRQMVLFLASKYMIDFDATHCQPLPTELFTLPWQPFQQ